ncbi:MAG: transmembrane 220 family protein [Burkholderiaceae bacterium]
MRILNIILGLLMIAFAAVQLNDPDTLTWTIYYLIGAIWALLAAIRPQAIRTPNARRLIWLCVAAALTGVAYYFPRMDRFWEKEVWWVEETAREGMGVMTLALVLLIVAITSRPRATSESPDKAAAR